MLEQEYDRRAEAAIPSADVLGAEFERFLRTQRDDDPTTPTRDPIDLAVLSASDCPWRSSEADRFGGSGQPEMRSTRRTHSRPGSVIHATASQAWVSPSGIEEVDLHEPTRRVAESGGLNAT